MLWDRRDFTVAEAAAISGIHRANIDNIIHRAKDCEVLFSEKRKHRRWFSPRDVAVLRIAYECERAGHTWLSALGRAFEHLQEPPAPDAVLTFRAKSTSIVSGRILRGGTAQVHVDDSTVLIPIGKIVTEIIERCAKIKEASLVALQS